METLFYIALAVLISTALTGVGMVTYALFERRDRKYRRKHRDFVEQKQRVGNRIKETQERLDYEQG